MPGTHLNNGYSGEGGADPLDAFADLLEASGVAVIGITNYFALGSCVEAIAHFRSRHPASAKVLMPCMEVRLPEVVNRQAEEVNVHLIFPEGMTSEQASNFERQLLTELCDENGRHLPCSELVDAAQFVGAAVSRPAITKAFEECYGKDAVRQDHFLVVTSCKGDGIRPPQESPRKRNLSDDIDKFSDGIFGGSSNSEYYLDPNRADHPATKFRPKPVFAGSDSHSFNDLRQLLGRTVTTGDHHAEVTWVKADPGFAGLCQTLIAPLGRVAIQPTQPDQKEPYQVIAAVRFPESSTFPNRILLNQNLVSIIGSRSSGKSSLLAYMAYAIDPSYTVQQQVAANGYRSEAEAGPAAGMTWADALDINCEIEWADPRTKSGRVIYIPQNSLFAISERPDEITAKIEPALYRRYPDFEAVHSAATADVQRLTVEITARVDRWFDLQDESESLATEVRGLGDRPAVEASRDAMATEIINLRSASSLGDEEVEAYQEHLELVAAATAEAERLEAEILALGPYVSVDLGGHRTPTAAVTAAIALNPQIADLPAGVHESIRLIVETTEVEIRSKVGQELASYVTEASRAAVEHRQAVSASFADNAGVIAKNAANSELDVAVARHSRQVEALRKIHDAVEARASIEREIVNVGSELAQLLADRESTLRNLIAVFDRLRPQLDDDLTVGIEVATTTDSLRAVSQAFDHRSASSYLDQSDVVDIGRVQHDPLKFLGDLRRGDELLRSGYTAKEIARNTLAVNADVRFFAQLDGDRIGGFERSSMTPGKQSLFALTLILTESDEPWPLLIDQPEDDLDSRAIYDHIVTYLLKRKQTRQILMVTHNANLAVGADSEQIIVANRHGDDRRNKDARTFDYLGGSLEYSASDPSAEAVLESYGIREHACEILDGGKDAFRKRGEMYRI